MKKVFGILLLIIGILFVLVVFGRLTSLISDVLGIIRIFDSNISGYQRGDVFGGFIYWVLHFLVIYFAFKFGSKWIKNKKTSTNS